jgi:hypothetical protein
VFYTETSLLYYITYPTGEPPTQASRPLLPSPHQNPYYSSMSQQQPSLQPSNERQIQLALQAIKGDALLSQQRAAAIYNVAQRTLGDRRAGRPSRNNIMPNSSNLTKLKEDVVAEHIINLVERRFPPRLAEVANIANSLRAERNIGYISLN